MKSASAASKFNVFSAIVVVQAAAMVLVLTATMVIVTFYSVPESVRHVSWALFTALMLVGLVTALHATRIGWVGGGHLFLGGVTPLYVAVSIRALEVGGPPALLCMFLGAGLVFFAAARWLPMLRRVLTLPVIHTTRIFIAIMILPFGLALLRSVPEGVTQGAGTVVALVMVWTIVVFASIAKAWRVFMVPAGLALGCISAGLLNLYDFGLLASAPWIGFPTARLPGWAFTPTVDFWALLPMVLVVAGVHATKIIGDATRIQQAKCKEGQAIDFRSIQGSTYANGIGIVLSGFVGTAPITGYAGISKSIARFIHGDLRGISYGMAVLFILFAFSPKLTAALLTVPRPILATLLLLALVRMIMSSLYHLARSRLDTPTKVVVGLVLICGIVIPFQGGITESFPPLWSELFNHSLIVGTVLLIALLSLLESLRRRRGRKKVSLQLSSFPEIDRFLEGFGARMGWAGPAAQKLRSAGEEAFASLMELNRESGSDETPLLFISAGGISKEIDLEFLVVFDSENLEERLALLDDLDEVHREKLFSFRLLRHYASSVSHRQYHGIDIVKVTVKQ